MFFGLQSYLSVDPDIINFGLDGGTVTLNIYCSGDWSVNYKPSWVNISPSSGTGSRTITVSAGAYPEQRLGSITLSNNNLSLTLLVSQGDYGAV